MTTANISDHIVKTVTMSGLDYHLTQTPYSIQFSIRKKFTKRFDEVSENNYNSFEVEKLLEETEVLKQNLNEVKKEYRDLFYMSQSNQNTKLEVEAELYDTKDKLKVIENKAEAGNRDFKKQKQESKDLLVKYENSRLEIKQLKS